MQEKEISNKLANWYICDLKKPEIDKFERAAIIRNFLDKENMSIRQFAREYGINKSTVEDWLLYNRITEKQYNEFIAQGIRPLDIYRSLRENKTSSPVIKSEVDLILEGTAKKLKKFIVQGAYTEKTYLHAKELINQINRLLMRVEAKK